MQEGHSYISLDWGKNLVEREKICILFYICMVDWLIVYYHVAKFVYVN